MYPSKQLINLFVFVHYVNGIFSQNSTTALLQIEPTKSTDLKETLTESNSVVLEITSLFTTSYSERKYVESSISSTPSLLVLPPRNITTTSASIQAMSSTHFSGSVKFQRTNDLSLYLKSSDGKLSTEINPSQVVISSTSPHANNWELEHENSSDWMIMCPKGCQCAQCKDGGIGKDKLEMKCKTENLTKFLKEFGIPKRKVCSL